MRIFENTVLRRTFGPTRDEGLEEWRKLHNEKLNDTYSSPNIIRVIKSRRMRWVGHVGSIGARRVVYGFWKGNLRESDHLDDQGIDWRIILRWIFK